MPRILTSRQGRDDKPDTRCRGEVKAWRLGINEAHTARRLARRAGNIYWAEELVLLAVTVDTQHSRNMDSQPETFHLLSWKCEAI